MLTNLLSCCRVIRIWFDPSFVKRHSTTVDSERASFPGLAQVCRATFLSKLVTPRPSANRQSFICSSRLAQAFSFNE